MANPSQAQSKPGKPQKSSGKRFTISPIEVAGIAAFFILPFLLPALWSGRASQWLPPRVRTYISPTAPAGGLGGDVDPASPALLEACRTHTYSTEIISLDPLMIYINNFTSPSEASALIKLGEAYFTDSFIAQANGQLRKVSGRTSQSAPLNTDHPLVSCILARARAFLGTTLLPSEPFSLPQLVRYNTSQRYDLHTDFWPQHQLASDGSGRSYNRPASFFVFLRANCTGGETYFPGVHVLDADAESGGALEERFRGKVGRGPVEKEKNGKRGVMFRPVLGSAVFWVNINRLGKGDRRVVHAGLPVLEGEKIGMNLWPRKFYEAEGRVGEGRMAG